MQIVSTSFISGKELETLSLVCGSVVHSKNFGKDFLAGLKSFVGGELKPYTDMTNEAVKEATERMITEAKALGADAVIHVRYESQQAKVELAPAMKVLAYGTAVKFI